MATGIEFGVHEDPTAGGRTPAQVKAKYPHAIWGRAFVAGEQATGTDLRPKFDNLIPSYLSAGLKVIVSVKTNVADTRNGLMNARFVELGAHLEATYPTSDVEVIWYHEPEDNMDGQAFVHAFNKVHDKIQEGGPNVKVGMASMTYQWAMNWNNTASIGGHTDNPSEWLSYNGVPLKADFLAADVYSGRSFPLDQTLGAHPGYVRWLDEFAEPLMALRSEQIPIYLTERGFETPSSTEPTTRYQMRVDTIEAEFAYLAAATEPITKYIFWSSPGTENAPGLVMDPTAEDAIIAGMDAAASPPPPSDCTQSNLDNYNQGYAAGFVAGRQSYKDDFIAGMPAV